MTMFHINPQTGDASQCRATQGKCPFGSADKHFTSLDSARDYYENSQKAQPKISSVRELDGQITYDMAEQNFVTAEKAIEKANKRLEKLGLNERFTFTKTEYLAEDPRNPLRAEERIKLTLSSPAIKFDDYTFLAVVEQADAGFVVKQAAGMNLHGYTPDDLTCEACGRAIARQKTYLVEDAEGNMVQVGSGCVKKYFGVQPDGLWALTWDPVEKATDSVKWSSTPSAMAVKTEDLMGYALAASEGGEKFISKGLAYEYGMDSTADDVKRALNGSDDEAVAMQNKANDYVVSGDAKRLLRLIKKMDASSDYGRNMVTLANGEYTRWGHVNLLVSGLSLIAKQKRDEEKAKADAQWGQVNSGYIAPIGETMAGRKLKIKSVYHKTQDDPYSYYGGQVTTSQIVFRDENNNEAVWWSSKKIDVESGDEITVKSGKVKAHKQFRGVDQTVLTRVKL